MLPSRVVPLRLALLAALVLALPASAVPPAQEARRASRVWIAEEEVDKVEIVAARSEPPTFTLVLVREMPTPGFTWRVDALEADARSRRITARVTETGPAGMVAQVITPTRFELPLGELEPGSYFVELWTRRDASAEHRPAHALVIEAR
jgi:hypothetical protein